MELGLRAGDWSATLLPLRGAAFARLEHAGVPVLAPMPQGADPNATPAGAFWMMPWTNRMAGGVLGPGWRLPVNRRDEDTAIHGLSRDHTFDVVSAALDRVRLMQDVDIAPYAYRVALAIRLRPEGLSVAAMIINRGDGPAPIGLGWHPWFARRPGQRLSFAARHRLRSDARLLPVDAVADPGFTAAPVEALIGTDAHFAGWGGAALLEDTALRLELRAGGAWARNLQLYLPPHADSICLEPVSHIPDAPNRPALAQHGALGLLAAGAARRAWFRLRA
ncbi:MAG: aldose epimerase [Pseudomonadota bacterium]